MVPAHGCTGPTAYALAAARCRPHLTAPPESMTVYVSPAFLKIGFGVATPGTATPGIPIAAAAGLMGGDHTLGLSVLKPCTPADMECLAGKRRDLASLDCTNGRLDMSYIGHMGATENRRVREKLVSIGAADEKTVFVANHFSHNGLAPYKQVQATAQGMLVAYDGMAGNT